MLFLIHISSLMNTAHCTPIEIFNTSVQFVHIFSLALGSYEALIRSLSQAEFK